MRNFANGHGFVYNVGSERVEGFTSTLWTLIGSLFFFVSKASDIGFCLLIFNVAIVSYSLTRTCIFINRYFGNSTFLSYQVVVFLGLLIALPGYFDWSITSLMETGLWSSLLILISLDILEFEPSSQRRVDYKFAGLLVLLVLCRPESMLWGSFFLMSRGVQCYLSNISVKKIIFPSAIFLLTIGVITSWRLLYFGYPFPNTYYAKVSSDWIANISMGAVYVKDYFKDNVLVLFVFLMGLKFLFDRIKILLFKLPEIERRTTDLFKIFFLIFISLLTFFAPLLTGGDHFLFYRFIQPTVPLMLMLFLFLLKFYGFKAYKNWAVWIMCFALISSKDNILHSVRTKKYLFSIHFKSQQWGETEAKQLNQFFSPCNKYPTQGILPAGASAFFYKGNSIDLLGLNNVKMAHADKIKDTSLLHSHASFNKEIFFEQRPDIVCAAGGFINRSEINDTFYTQKNTLSLLKHVDLDVRFYKEYSKCLLINKGTNQAFETFASNNFINTLDTNNFIVKRDFKFDKYE